MVVNHLIFNIDRVNKYTNRYFMYVCNMLSKAERTRNLILEKSAPIFNQLGYGDTSLSTICESAGLTKGAVYSNFKDKNELALDAFNFIVRQSIFPLSDQINSVRSPKVKLTVLFDYYRKYYKRTVELGGCPILNVGMDTTHQNSELRKRVTQVINKLILGVENIIIQGQTEGEFTVTVTANRYAKRIYSMIEGSIFTAIIQKDEAHIIEMMNYLDTMVQSELHQ